ncbi:MAG TPA: YidC/Oxa1 family membrane protein insertase [Ktedonobacterales bacterium]
MGSIFQIFGQLLHPIGELFHYVFYEPIFNILILIYDGVHAIAPFLPVFAIAILVLTVLVRLCLFPLTRKQLQSSRAMQALAPQIAELKKKHPNDPQGLMAAQQALYREHGVSMYGGCLPLLIQMPFLYALYFSLYTALISSKGETVAKHLARINGDIYPFLPHLAALPNSHFLWTNLGAPDPWKILPILAALFTFIQLRMAQPVKAPVPVGQKADPNTQAMGSMMYIMPVITFIMGLSFPSGLAFYWSISTAFSGVQQFLLSGWGSLFVGIPGMEHLVPAPQTVPGRPAAAVSIVDASPPAQRPSSLSGLRAALRQLTAPPPANAAENQAGAAAARNGNGTGKSSADANGADGRTGQVASKTSTSGESNGDANGGAPHVKRARPERVGPTLVKSGAQAPAAMTSVEADGAAPARANGATPAKPPAPAAAARANGSATTPSTRRPASPSSTGSRATRSSTSARRRSGGKSKGGR